MQPQTNIFPWNNNPSSIKPSTVVWVKISEKKKKKKFPDLNLFTFFKVGIIMVSKYGHLMLPEVFLDKITLAIDFIDQAVVQCDVLVVKILL